MGQTQRGSGGIGHPVSWWGFRSWHTQKEGRCAGLLLENKGGNDFPWLYESSSVHELTLTAAVSECLTSLVAVILVAPLQGRPTLIFELVYWDWGLNFGSPAFECHSLSTTPPVQVQGNENNPHSFKYKMKSFYVFISQPSQAHCQYGNRGMFLWFLRQLKKVVIVSRLLSL